MELKNIVFRHLKMYDLQILRSIFAVCVFKHALDLENMYVHDKKSLKRFISKFKYLNLIII